MSTTALLTCVGGA